VESESKREARWWMLAFLVWVFLASLGPVIEFDLWFRLRLGQELFRSHGLGPGPRHFLWPQPVLADSPTLHCDDLFSLWVFGIQQSLGVQAFPCITALLVTAIFAVIWQSLGKIGWPAPYRVLLGFLCFKLFEGRLMLRPQLFTDLALAWLVLLYLKDRETPNRHLPLTVGLLFFVWMSLHSGASLGLPVIFCLFGGEDLAARRIPKRALLLSLAALAGCCCGREDWTRWL